MENKELLKMANNEGLKLELELEVKRIETEIKEKELLMFNNELKSVKAKEEIDESDIPEEEIIGLIENILSGNDTNDDVLLDNLFLMGALAYKNFCIEDSKFGLMALQEKINKQIEEL